MINAGSDDKKQEVSEIRIRADGSGSHPGYYRVVNYCLSPWKHKEKKANKRQDFQGDNSQLS